MIDQLRIEKDILEEKLLKKMKQATYYKKKYLEDHRKLKEVREYIENNDIMKVEKEGKLKGQIFLDKGLLEILDKEIKNGDN